MHQFQTSPCIATGQIYANNTLYKLALYKYTLLSVQLCCCLTVWAYCL